MRLEAFRPVHLTYCTNIHAGESWRAVRENLERYVVAVKRQVAPKEAFGIGLRLSAEAAASLAEPREIELFREFLTTNDLYVFTINGFPFGAFHGARVKENVYRPDWLEGERVAYTDRLARILAELLPRTGDLEGSVSTVPGAFKARAPSDREGALISERILSHLVTLHRLREESGRVIALALEPEPACYIETVAESIAFFERWLFSRAAQARFCALSGVERSGCEAFLRNHVGVCFDACHMSVEFEDPRDAVRRLCRAGIKIPKMQISAGLKVELAGDPRSILDELRTFDEGTYLHQVVERRRPGGGIHRYDDLFIALDAIGADLPPGRESREWRIHFHVPIFRSELGTFASTQGDLVELLDVIRDDAPSGHLEVETYCWDVLPEAHRKDGVVADVSRELQWVRERLRG